MELAGNPVHVRRAVAAAGAASLLAQVVLLRELLAFSQGNELVLGVALGVWLCLTAAASAVGGRLARTWDGPRARAALRVLLSLAPVSYVAGFACTALARPDALGEPAPLPTMLAVVTAALLPACMSGGLAFAWAAQASPQANRTRVYVAETAAAAVAGLLFHFLLGERLPGLWILVLAGVGCAGAAVGVASGPGRRAWKASRLPLAAVLVAISLGPKLATTVEHAHFPGETVLSLRPSRYGQLGVLARGSQRVFTQDGVLLFTSEDQLAAEESIHLPLLLHPAPRRLLLLGGGLGGGLVEALKHGPERLDYAEVDPGLLALVAEYGDADTRAALRDPRVHVVAGDGRSVLRRVDHPYDVILIQVPVPQNALMARYSSRECFEDARRALGPGGLLAVVTPGSDAHLGEAARRRHAAVVATLKDVFPAIGVAPGAETILWASEQLVEARPGVLATRLQQRAIAAAQVGPTWLLDRLLPMHVARYQRALATEAAVTSRDFRPVVYLLGLLETLQRLSPRWAKGGLDLRGSSRSCSAAGMALLVACLVWGLRRKRPAPGFAAAVAGAAGMSLQLVLLMAYQSLRGHLYHALGLLLAVSMAGMAMGAWYAGRLAERHGLAWALGAVAGMALGTAAMLSLAGLVPNLAVVAVGPLLLLVGAATGAVYPMAVQVAGQAGGAATIYAWDLVGAAVAALLASVLVIPCFGLAPVALLCAGLCGVGLAANIAKS